MPICRPPLGEPRLMPNFCSLFGLLGEPGGHGLMPICHPPFGEHGLMPICCFPSGPTQPT